MTTIDRRDSGTFVPKAHGFLAGWGIAVTLAVSLLAQQPALATLMILTP
jgi:hypothetical protein